MGSWQMINFTEAELLPRWSPCVSILNSTEIVIMGGNGYIDDDLSSLGDVYLLDSQSDRIEKKVTNFPGLLQFNSAGNKCAQFQSDNVVALVEDVDQTKTIVVEFKKGQRMVKTIKTL